MFNSTVYFIAPEDKSKWYVFKNMVHNNKPPKRINFRVWDKCFRSWLNSSFNVVLLNDTEDVDNLILKYDSEDFFDVLHQLPFVYRLDYVRYLIMANLGGGYVDMDVQLRLDFRHLLNEDNIYIMGRGNNVETSMIFSPRSEFWEIAAKTAKQKILDNFDLINHTTERYRKKRGNSKRDMRLKTEYLTVCADTVGANMLKSVVDTYDGEEKIVIFPDNYFNFNPDNPFAITRHFTTGKWRLKHLT